MKKVSAIICVLNEEKTLRNVIMAVWEDSSINEIVVVNDCSTDNTQNIINELKQFIEIKDIHLAENKGKGYAMAVGAENATGEILVFIDADQTTIILGYIDQIVNPILRHECDMVCGYSTVNIMNQDVNPLKILTGERAFLKKDIAPILDRIKESRFGVETLLYFYYTSIGKSIKFVRLGIKHDIKYKKMPPLQATTNYICESWEIAYAAMKNYDLILKSAEKKLRKGLRK